MNSESSPGRKDDTGKLRRSLVPLGTLGEVLCGLEYGAARYGDDNWQRVENARTRYYDALHRHVEAWWHGEIRDSESGLHHLAHAICCGLFLMWFDLKAKDT